MKVARRMPVVDGSPVRRRHAAHRHRHGSSPVAISRRSSATGEAKRSRLAVHRDPRLRSGDVAGEHRRGRGRKHRAAARLPVHGAVGANVGQRRNRHHPSRFGQPSPGIERGGHEGEVATGGIAGIAVARRRSSRRSPCAVAPPVSPAGRRPTEASRRRLIRQPKLLNLRELKEAQIP